MQHLDGLEKVIVAGACRSYGYDAWLELEADVEFNGVVEEREVET